MNARPLMLFVPLLALLPGVAVSAVYKWVDENGQVQYTQTPPPGGVEATEIAPPPEPPDDPGAVRREQGVQEGLEDRRESRDEAAKTAAEDADYAKQKAERCEAAKHRLEQAQYPRVTFTEADGSQRRATDEEREQQIKESGEQVKKFCG